MATKIKDFTKQKQNKANYTEEMNQRIYNALPRFAPSKQLNDRSKVDAALKAFAPSVKK